MTSPLSVWAILWTTAADPLLANLVTRVVPAGDVNGDGFADLVLLDSDSFGDATTGTVRLYFGSPAGFGSSPEWEAPRIAWSAAPVTTVARAGDVNGDGYDDVILGAPGAVNPSGTMGLVLLLHGGPAGLAGGVAWSAESTHFGGSGFGAALASAGDVNADGFDDVLVGEWGASSTSYYAGSASVFLGSAAGLAATPIWTAEGLGEWDTFGTDVASAGDVNGDGFDDVAVGASCDWTQEPSGRLDVFFGGPGGPSATPDWTFRADVGEVICTQLGNEVTSAGDVNGDGYDDLVAGAPFQSPPGEVSAFPPGSAVMFLGSPSGLGSEPAWFVSGHRPNAAFGRSVGSAGDIDGDGYDDVLVGAPLDSDPFGSEGRVFLYLGGPTGLVDGPATIEASGEQGAQLGTRVAGLGDVNGDGLGDVLLGGAGHLGTTTGAGWVFAGTGDCASGVDDDGNNLGDLCEICVGDDESGDQDGDRWCASGTDGDDLDCDDTNPDAHPMGVEVCDGDDNDCDGLLPDDEVDADGDGVFPCGGDCDDADPDREPYVDEVCGNGLDDNCDGKVDEACPSAERMGCGCASTQTSAWWLVAFLFLRRRT